MNKSAGYNGLVHGIDKHAYLILAYNNWKVLNLQLQMIDDRRNDIFLHVDQKSKDFSKEFLPELKYSNLFLIDRMPVYWADYSQVKAIICLMKEAFRSGTDYLYFHLLSSSCLPIKSQDYIHEFCDGCLKNLIGIVPKEYPYCTKRVRFYYPFIDTVYYRKHKALKALVQGIVLVQRIIGVNRLKQCNWAIYNGWDWASVTNEFAKYLVGHENTIEKMFRKTLCPSELWMHTIAMNTDFKETIYDLSGLKKGSMRYIDWQRGRPYTWGQEQKDDDFHVLINSPYLFARKFDESVDFEIAEQIFNEVTS